MSKEIVTVKYVNAPAAGKKKGNIKTTDGRIFGVWPDKLDQFKAGGTYEIETESNEYQGKTYHSVKSATAVNGTAAPAEAETNGISSNGGKSPEVQARIERQHSQEMAIRFIALTGVTAFGDAPETSVRTWTDYFQRDLANSVVAKANANEGFEL